MITRFSAIGIAIALVVSASGRAAAQTTKPAPRADQGVASQRADHPDANPQAVALAEFQKRMQGYLELRGTLAQKLKPLSSTADSAELAARQDTLAAAIREMRKGAKPGDVIPTRVAEQIRNTVVADLRRRNADTKRAVFEEVPDGARPVVNRTVSDNSALATVPPLLLNNLPPLPDNLQYRFMHRHVVLIDGDTRIIVDYIPDVLPPH